jgi:hypothetical protein
LHSANCWKAQRVLKCFATHALKTINRSPKSLYRAIILPSDAWAGDSTFLHRLLVKLLRPSFCIPPESISWELIAFFSCFRPPSHRPVWGK